jgi:Protein of unknown function (DUF3455)
MRRVLATIAAATALAASLMVTGVGAAGATELAPSTQSGATADRTGGGGPTPNASLPAAIKVDETQFKVVSTMRGIGKQVYDCGSDGKYPVSPREPVAGLVSTRGVPTGIHGAGPFWASFDGSRVTGTGNGSTPSSDPSKNVPWLRVAATATFGEGGVFSNVKFIQRTDTRGGVAPTTPCTAPSTVAVDYSTYYVFWVPKT